VYSRECRDDLDFEEIRRLLIESYALNQRFHNWWLERIEGQRYHRPVKGDSGDWRTGIRLWFTDEDKLVGVVNPEGEGVAFIQIHPRHSHIEPMMVEWAERDIAHAGDDGVKRLSFWVYDYDEKRQRLLESRGYTKTGRYGHTRRRSLKVPVPEAPIPEGYSLRPLTEEDSGLVADSINLIFGRDFHTEEACRNMYNAPTFPRDLNLALFTGGTLASFATVWYHPANNIGVFEPVGTHPDHRRRGLSTVLMYLGMRKLVELGADYVYVGTGSREAPNRLYSSLGFNEVDTSYEWRLDLR
jgi:mycothiol synthase